MDIMQDHELSCDVLVAGGGPAGVPAALAAARSGASVVLCQDRSVLGGNASSEVRMHIVGADCSGGRGVPLETETREGGIIEEIRLATCVQNRQRSASMLDLILYDLCRVEPNLTLLLNTRVVDVALEGDRISYAMAVRPLTEDRFRIHADVFIDCTGDGALGVAAGAPYRVGREARNEYGEPAAQDVEDNKTLGSTILFQARRHDRSMPFTAPEWARTFTEDDLRLRPHGEAGIDRGLEYGYWWTEWGGELDTIRDNESIRDELLAIVMGIWDHIKNDGDHGADNWALEWFGFLPGKRESRRFMGQYVLNEQDVLESRQFEDAFAFGGWHIDVHPPAGVDAVDEEPCDQRMPAHIYDIPLRSCVTDEPVNLMFAGRNISATHLGFASTRVMATCAVVGQGVGTAAAYAVAHGVAPASLSSSPDALHAIQQRLLRDDAFLIGIANNDPDDLARTAEVTSLSEQPGGDATNVTSGQTRSVHGLLGAPKDRSMPGAHRWMSDPAQGFPASITLRWDAPVDIASIELVFDTGMHRPLTLSHSDAYVELMEWGHAQPETVRDYLIEADVDGNWQTIAAVSDNYQRHRVHMFDYVVSADALRINVLATNGLDHARINEIRVYGPKSLAWL